MSDPRIVLAEVLYRVERGDVLPTTERREAYRRQKADAILTALSERGYIIIASDNLTAALQGLRNDRILFERTIRTLNERPSASAASHISRWSRAAIEDIDAFLTSLTIKSHQERSVMSEPWQRRWRLAPRTTTTVPAIGSVVTVATSSWTDCAPFPSAATPSSPRTDSLGWTWSG